MSKNDGTPLPAALDGVIAERPIRIDRALLYLIGGALAELVDRESLEQTGTLTVDDARAALSDMLWDFYHEEPAVTYPTGMIMIWAANDIPSEMLADGWLLCDGSFVLRADYPALFALIGTAYGEDDETNFALPDMRGRAPIGVRDTDIPGVPDRVLGEHLGTHEVYLTDGNIPAHSHALKSSAGVNLVTANGATSGNLGLTASTITRSTTNVVPLETHLFGEGHAHENMQPSTVVNFIIKAT